MCIIWETNAYLQDFKDHLPQILDSINYEITCEAQVIGLLFDESNTPNPTANHVGIFIIANPAERNRRSFLYLNFKTPATVYSKVLSWNVHSKSYFEKQAITILATSSIYQAICIRKYIIRLKSYSVDSKGAARCQYSSRIHGIL